MQALNVKCWMLIHINITQWFDGTIGEVTNVDIELLNWMSKNQIYADL